MKLPDRFQMRLNTFPGFTHLVKKNTWGDYEVTWARGFPNKIGSLPCMVWSEGSVVDAVMDCRWEVVDDAPKAEEKQALPDEFYFQDSFYCDRTNYHAKVTGETVRITWKSPRGGDKEALYPKSEVEHFIKKESWKIVDKPSLTPEQQRALKEYKERIAQLDASIRINEQSLEHYNRMIANYKEVQEGLRNKIVELENI